MKNLIKSAEIYGGEAVVYSGSDSPPEEFLRLIVNNELIPGEKSGSTYGKGVYTVYNLAGTQTANGDYGKYVYKLKVNLYGFISFNPDVTKKIYGESLTPSQQYERVSGKRGHIFEKLKDLESESYSFSSDLANPASEFLRGKVKGILFSGRQDGDVAVIYDASTIVPVAWKNVSFDKTNPWNSFNKEEISPAIGRGMIGSFQESKYEDAVGETELESAVKVLSRFSKDTIPEGVLKYVNHLIENDTFSFIYQYSEKKWAKPYLDSAAKKMAENDTFYFLLYFSDKPWAAPYLDSAAKNLAEKYPYKLLYSFSDKPWAEPYLDSAAKKVIENDTYAFLKNFKDKPWAAPYLDSAAKNLAEKDPYNLLFYFSDKPWAAPYLDSAAKNLAEKDPYKLLYSFDRYKPWAEPYLDSAAKKVIEKDPYVFISSLRYRPRAETWAEPYLDLAAVKYAEEASGQFIDYFQDKNWANIRRDNLNGKSYLEIALDNYLRNYNHSMYFLRNYNKKTWATKPREHLNGKSYLDLAAKNIIETDAYDFEKKFKDFWWATEKREDLGNKSYLDLAMETIEKDKKLSQEDFEREISSRASYSSQLSKLAKVLNRLGFKMEAKKVINFISQ